MFFFVGDVLLEFGLEDVEGWFFCLGVYFCGCGVEGDVFEDVGVEFVVDFVGVCVVECGL